ncbi:MAG TPA: lamin tail domain-containing protein [Gemmatimonadaceae bacterium]
MLPSRVVLAVAAIASLAMVAGCRPDSRVAGSAAGGLAPRVAIDEIMVDPRMASDADGEWFEVVNQGTAPVSLRGWTIRSGSDAPRRIDADVSIPAGGYAVLASNADAARNGGLRATWSYGRGIRLGNADDWVSLHDTRGALVDSVAWRNATAGASWELDDPARPHAMVAAPRWRRATVRYGAGDLGTPGAPNGSVAPTPAGRSAASASAAAKAPATQPTAPAPEASEPVSPTELVVRVLDVGQGDATYIQNGASRVIVDGGPDTLRFGRLLDSLGLNGTTIDVVVLTHQHYDHHAGLRELFRSSRRITVRYFFENEDPYPNAGLDQLRDSVAARVERGETIARDTDDPCGDGRAICTITMRGGAKLHVMRPKPSATSPNDRSVPIKLVGPDSASFTMWLAGDAEHEEIDWFRQAGYANVPGMRVTVLKGDHHGSCNGVSSWYLQATKPEWVTFSVGARNTYGHAHDQAKRLYARFGVPWYRTDRNGTIEFRSPGTRGGGYTVSVRKGERSMSGSSDRVSTQPGCDPMP